MSIYTLIDGTSQGLKIATDILQDSFFVIDK